MTTYRLTCSALIVLSVALPAAADDGLQAPPAAAVWPQWQARVTLHLVNATPLSSGLSSAPAAKRVAAWRLHLRHTLVWQLSRQWWPVAGQPGTDIDERQLGCAWHGLGVEQHQLGRCAGLSQQPGHDQPVDLPGCGFQRRCLAQQPGLQRRPGFAGRTTRRGPERRASAAGQPGSPKRFARTALVATVASGPALPLLAWAPSEVPRHFVGYLRLLDFL
jgi:hypothetical protein